MIGYLSMKECVAKRGRVSLHLIIIILVTVFIKYRFKKSYFIYTYRDVWR
jgi:hypothetical protein